MNDFLRKGGWTALAVAAGLAVLGVASAAATRPSGDGPTGVIVRPVVARDQVVPPGALQPPTTICFENRRRVKCKDYPTPRGKVHLWASAMLPRPHGSEQVWFVTFPSQGGKTCIGIVLVYAQKGHGYGGGDSPTCVRLKPCTGNACGVNMAGTDPGIGIMASLVPAGAQTLRVDFLDLGERTYSLASSPLIRGLPTWKASVLELHGLTNIAGNWYDSIAAE